MKSKRKVVFSTMLASLALLVLLAGCGKQNNNGNATPAASPSQSAAASNPAASKPAASAPGASESAAAPEPEVQYPIVIKHALGEAVIEKKPERVATIQWSNHDVALALGVVPVGFSAANYGVQDGSGLLPWTKKKLDELGETSPNIYQDTDDLDFEAISDSDPDVILAAYSGITPEVYATLSKIAPVVAYQTSPWVASWQEQVLYDAMGMGLQAEGEKLIQDTEALIKEKVAAFPELQGKKAAFASITANNLSSFYLYAPGDPRGDFLVELGMTYSETVTSQVPEGSFYIQVAAENADILNDTELLVTYGDENTLKALQADPLMGKIPAVKNGAVAVIGDNTPLAAAGTPNPLSIAYTIDEYLSILSEAAKKVNG